MTTIAPTLDRLLVEPIAEEETVAGLVIVRDGKNAEMQMGLVVASGPKSAIGAGTCVLYNPAAGTLIRQLRDGKYVNLRMMHDDVVQAILLP